MRLGRRTVAPAERLPGARVLVRPDLVREIAGAAAASPDAETGGPLFGTVQRSWEAGPEATLIASLLGTVPPGGAVLGEAASVGLGASGDGERAASALRWLRSVTGLDLVHLGDWHTHPGGAAIPSWGDVLTARAMRARAGAPLWLVAVAAGRSTERERLEAGAKGVTHQQRSLNTLDVRFYREAGGPKLIPVPTQVEAVALPRLPALPWHVADAQRFAAECRLLAAAGFRIGLEDAANGRPALALVLSRDGERPVRVLTGSGYPVDEPVVHDGFGRRVAIGDWTPQRFLVDLVREEW